MGHVAPSGGGTRAGRLATTGTPVAFVTLRHGARRRESRARRHLGLRVPILAAGFYPAGTRPERVPRLLRGQLATVELNATKYRLPSEDQFHSWAAQVPGRLPLRGQGARTAWSDGSHTFEERVRCLGDRLGCVRVVVERPRDDGFLELLLGSADPGIRYALDLRDPSWDGVEERLAEAGAVRVDDDSGRAGWAYLRYRELHYEPDELDEIAAQRAPVDDARSRRSRSSATAMLPDAPAAALRVAARHLRSPDAAPSRTTEGRPAEKGRPRLSVPSLERGSDQSWCFPPLPLPLPVCLSRSRPCRFLPSPLPAVVRTGCGGGLVAACSSPSCRARRPWLALLGVLLLGVLLLGVRPLLCCRARANRVTVALVGRPRADRDPDRVLALVTDRHLLAVLVLRKTDGALREPDTAERRKRHHRRCDDGNECDPAPASVPPRFLSCSPPTHIVVRLDRCSPPSARCIYEESSAISAARAGTRHSEG